MNTELAPIVGDRYRHLDKGQLFCVVAVDEDAGVVEMQHFDGDLEEVELAPWYEMTLEPAEAPEDWTRKRSATRKRNRPTRTRRPATS